MSDTGTGARGRRSRREQYADATKAAVVYAARQLFASQGYFATKVEEIARLSRVSPATIYAQCGGKQGLLRTLMDEWTEGPGVQAVVDAVRACESPREIIRILGNAYLAVHEDFGDVTRVVSETAPHDEEAARVLAIATQRHRHVLDLVAARLRELDGIADGLSDKDVADLVFYYFGRDRIGFVVTDLGWTSTRARDWIGEQLARTVLKSGVS
ncbi:TetR/AcrR family transcriptional regulator [Nocardioides agariphilus]|uniref:TetR/AcrR family transcriptional regulator n=1 Tax=Nocardioides agariphilus TaxID=433664 RepID=A0A930VPS4_9ACTN|nr:TetR/AcrR family transcriptional regulator [Nocardioides agariphilus]MBF4768788.1 TetR/AcrR family transcriptional regulator [Nocardioides agariphilus]